jgi:hypothetical protein
MLLEESSIARDDASVLSQPQPCSVASISESLAKDTGIVHKSHTMKLDETLRVDEDFDQQHGSCHSVDTHCQGYPA